MNAATGRRPLGLVAVLATVVMLFTAFTASYVVRRGASDWKPVPMPSGLALSTIVLAAVSLALEGARRTAGRARDASIGMAFILSALFLLAQAALFDRLRGAGIFLATGPHASFLYLLVGLHAVHVIGGVGALIGAAFRPAFTDACAAYWHTLLGIWVWLILLLWVI